MFSPKELAPNEDQGVVFGAIDVPANATLEQVTPYTEAGQPHLPEHARVRAQLPDHASRPAASAACCSSRGSERERSIFPIQAELNAKLMRHHRRPRAGVPAAGAAERRPLPGRVRDRLDRRARGASSASPSSSCRRRPRAGSSRSRRSSTCASTRPRPRSCSIATRSRRWASACSRSAPTSSSMLGGNFVNRFNIDGRSYKVIPQIERAGRLTPEQLEDIHVTGPERPADPAQRDRHAAQRASSRARSTASSSSTRSRSPASRTQSLDGGLARARRRRRPRSCRRATASTTPASRASCAQEGGKFLPAMGLALLLIFLVLAAQFNSFRDPFVILAGSVPLAMFGALIFTFLKFAGPARACASRSPRAGPRRSTSTRRSGWSRWSGLVAKNGILIVEFANAAAAARA